jgi:hypothetical protein
MRFDSDASQHLAGERFSSGLRVSIAEYERSLPGRIQYLVERAAGRRVIHVGCVDHVPLIQEKIRNGTWLHGRLCESAERCLGLDISPTGIAYLQTELGYGDVVCGDLLNDDIAAIREDQWDVLVMGEILEHVDDPVAFLSAIRERCASHVRSVVITVPNATAWDNIVSAFRNQEFINSDHRYWFTPYTSDKVACRAGMRVVDFRFCETDGVPPRRWIGEVRRALSLRRRLTATVPALRSTLVMELSL